MQWDLEKTQVVALHLSPVALWSTHQSIGTVKDKLLYHISPVSSVCLCSNKCVGSVVALSARWHVTVTGMWTLFSSLAWVWHNGFLFVFFLASSDYAFRVYQSPSNISSFLAVFGFCTVLVIFVFSLVLIHVSLFCYAWQWCLLLRLCSICDRWMDYGVLEGCYWQQKTELLSVSCLNCTLSTTNST